MQIPTWSHLQTDFLQQLSCRISQRVNDYVCAVPAHVDRGLNTMLQTASGCRPFQMRPLIGETEWRYRCQRGRVSIRPCFGGSRPVVDAGLVDLYNRPPIVQRFLHLHRATPGHVSIKIESGSCPHHRRLYSSPGTDTRTDWCSSGTTTSPRALTRKPTC